MWIVVLALRRPYTFVVCAIVLLLLTPFILLRTPTDIFPNIDIPVISAIWQYAGLDAQGIEQRLVYIHERAMTATVNDIEHIESTSYNGMGVIKVYLQPGASVDAGVSQITAVAQTVLKQMPPGQTPPLIIRYNASTVPILQYSITSKTLSEQAIYDMTLNTIRVGLSTIRGAAMPWPYGGRTREVSVDLDLPALKSKGLAPIDVISAISAQNLVLPGGTAKIGATEYDLEVNSTTKTIDELSDLPVKKVNGSVIYIRDVAQVRDGFALQRNIVRRDGVRGTLLTILKAGAASTLEVVKHVKEAMPSVLTEVPAGVEVREFADQSLFVRAAINGVLREGVVAAALTALMILLFIGSWRSTLIIAISIPLSVLSSLAILSALGETINLMTLGGLALAVGILVDDATVEIENVHRQMALGKPLKQAILDGAQEIALPAFVSTICICIVFVPMFFLTGVSRYLFVPLAEAVVFAMLASYVLSRTLIPTLVMWFYQNYNYYEEHAHGHGGVTPGKGWTRPFAIMQERFETSFDKFREGYRRLLEAVFLRRGVFTLLFLAFCLGSWILAPLLGQDFFPNVDAGQIRLHMRTRSGTRVEETAKLVDQVEAAIRREIPAHYVGGILDNIGIPNSSISTSYSNNGLIGTGDADILISLSKDHPPTDDFIRQLRFKLNREFPGNLFYFLPADIVSQTLNFGIPAPLDIQITGNKQAENREVAARLVEKMRSIPGAVDIRIQQPDDLPKLLFSVDRTKAEALGLTEADVASQMLLSVSGSGQVAPAYWLNTDLGIQYLIDVRAPERVLDSINALEALPVSGSRTGQASMQLLANVATMTRTNGLPVVSHYNVRPVIDVFGNVSGRDLGGVLRDLQPLLKQTIKELPRGSFLTLRGQAQTMHSSFIGLGVGLMGAIVLIYLLLVINFQSWLDPFIIITALPGALAGVIWGLFLTFTTLSVPALMGAIMSMGVATANAVLVITFARINLDRGMTSTEAALTAGAGRLRPVVMTALAMVIGMLPMSLGIGEGAEQNAPLGRAVIGGLILATVATLFFVPVVFSLMHRRDPKTAESSTVNDLEAMTLSTELK
ncbi:MAG TPA: efflux RND transporter permease subunit [Candidatus Saccharimonadales bacterium]|nr:efflux RND transporter permease subunit [Candidatus Saccharimonadales bacterium]